MFSLFLANTTITEAATTAAAAQAIGVKSPVATVLGAVLTVPVWPDCVPCPAAAVVAVCAAAAVDSSEYPVHVIVVPLPAASPLPSLIDLAPPSAYVYKSFSSALSPKSPHCVYEL